MNNRPMFDPHAEDAAEVLRVMIKILARRGQHSTADFARSVLFCCKMKDPVQRHALFNKLHSKSPFPGRESTAARFTP